MRNSNIPNGRRMTPARRSIRSIGAVALRGLILTAGGGAAPARGIDIRPFLREFCVTQCSSVVLRGANCNGRHAQPCVQSA